MFDYKFNVFIIFVKYLTVSTITYFYWVFFVLLEVTYGLFLLVQKYATNVPFPLDITYTKYTEETSSSGFKKNNLFTKIVYE